LVRSFILEMALEKERQNQEWLSLLEFYENPENQKIRPDILEEVLEKLKDFGVVLLSFYKNPQNQSIHPEIFETTLIKAAQYGWWGELLAFYENPENQFKIQSHFSYEIYNKIIKAANSISDKNLIPLFYSEMYKYLLSENESLAFINFSSKENLPLLIFGKKLGIDPFVIQSWHLSEEEKEALFFLFVSLSEKDIKFKFPFPYYPRPELKTTKRHNKILIEYFTNLNFSLSLPKEIIGDEIETHFKRLEEIVQKHNINQTTLKDISYSFLKELISEMRSFERAIYDKIRRMFKIEKEITFKQLKGFVKESRFFYTLINLATHYSGIYPEGLELLGKIVSAILKDNYFEMRYDLNDSIAKDQLTPLLEGKDPKEYRGIIEKWRKNYFVFNVLSGETKKEMGFQGVDWQQIFGHLRSQIWENKHYEHLFGLEEFKTIDAGSKNKLIDFFGTIFSSEKKPLKIGELKEILKRLNLKESKVEILIGYIQLLRDLSLQQRLSEDKQKSPKDILSTIEKLQKKIEKEWEGFGNLTLWKEDIFEYLNQAFKLAEEKEIKRKKIYLSYLTDHPRILLEIGKYPVSTCQSYESRGDLNKKLLGYVFDAHIKVLVLREVKLEEEIDEETLRESEVKIDENKEEIEIKAPTGKILKGKISKPVARRIVMLGKKENRPVLLLEPLYSIRGRDDPQFQKLLDLPLEEIKRELSLKTTSVSKRIRLPYSRNPEGYYRDI